VNGVSGIPGFYIKEQGEGMSAPRIEGTILKAAETPPGSGSFLKEAV